MHKRFLILLFTLFSFSSCFKEDKIAPVITLHGEKNYITKIGNAYKEPGFDANDNRDGDITYLVKIEGTVDSTQAGIYYLRYNVQDASENPASEQLRTIYVSHYNESLSGIYEAEGQCHISIIDNSNYFVVIDPDANEKAIKIRGVNNLTRDDELKGNLTSNTGSNIIIPTQVINDTAYSGDGTINASGSAISLNIYISAGNYADTCYSILQRQVR